METDRKDSERLDCNMTREEEMEENMRRLDAFLNGDKSALRTFIVTIPTERIAKKTNENKSNNI